VPNSRSDWKGPEWVHFQDGNRNGTLAECRNDPIARRLAKSFRPSQRFQRRYSPTLKSRTGYRPFGDSPRKRTAPTWSPLRIFAGL